MFEGDVRLNACTVTASVKPPYYTDCIEINAHSIQVFTINTYVCAIKYTEQDFIQEFGLLGGGSIGASTKRENGREYLSSLTICTNFIIKFSQILGGGSPSSPPPPPV